MSLGPLMISIDGTVLSPREREWLCSPLVGGVILFSRNYAQLDQLAALVADIHAVRSPPLLVAVDQEGGRVQRFGDPFTRLAPARVLGHLYDERPDAAEDAARSLAWLMAAELRAVGVDLSFAPVVDLDLGLAEVIGDRAWHKDPAVVARLARAFMAGAEQAGMVATAKHFPTHAGAIADSHTELAHDARDFDELEPDLAPYGKLIGAGLHSIMVGHVAFPALDPLPASLSSWWIRTQLREALEFKGAVISDDMSMVGASAAGGLADRVIGSLEAGCDMVLVCNVPEQVSSVLDRLDGYESPNAQLRLMRLRGRGGPRAGRGWDTLRASPEWQRAARVAANLLARPRLELEG